MYFTSSKSNLDGEDYIILKLDSSLDTSNIWTYQYVDYDVNQITNESGSSI